MMNRDMIKYFSDVWDALEHVARLKGKPSNLGFKTQEAGSLLSGPNHYGNYATELTLLRSRFISEEWIKEGKQLA